jgi:hypothetical protein
MKASSLAWRKVLNKEHQISLKKLEWTIDEVWMRNKKYI